MRKNMKYGTEHPNKIDTISNKDGKVILSIIQADVINDDNLMLLQAKLNNYLAYILDGQLDKEFPKYRGFAAKIEIHFQFEPQGIVLEFLSKATASCAEEGIKLTYEVGISNIA